MNKLLLTSILVFSLIPNSGYSATEKPPQVASTSTIHIDNVSIKAEDDSNESKINEEDKKRLIYEIGESGREEVKSWLNLQFFLLVVALTFGVSSGIYALIKSAVNSQVSKQLEKLLEKLDDARYQAIQATALAIGEVDRSRQALADAQRLQISLSGELALRSSEIEQLREKSETLRKSLESAYEDLRVDVKDNIDYLTTGDIVQTKWLRAIDETNEGENKVIDSLIADLNSTDNDARNSAAEQLSYFDDVDGKIITAFEALLDTESQTAFGAIILSKLGKLDKNDKAFDILSNLSNDLDSPNSAAVIGAIGNLQENRKDDPAFIGKIVDKLIEILENLNLKPHILGSVEADENANKKNAVALALSYSGSLGEKAIPLLISMVDDATENEYRKSAAIALGNIGKKAVRAIPVLERLAQDPLPQMRSVAEEAIKNIRQPNVT